MPKRNTDNSGPVPRLAVGAVVVHQKRVLLVRRKNPPYQGEWAIPGGKVKWGETLQQAAEREILEETGIHIRAHQPVYTFELIEGQQQQVNWHYVIIDLDCTWISGEPHASSDALAARWFTPQEISRAALNSNTFHLLKNVICFLDN